MSDNQANSVDKENVDTTNVEAPKVYTVEILRMIKELQQQHGLRHGDYQRYRGYCTRRVKRLRKTLNLPQGDKRHFKKREVTVTHLEGKMSNEKFVHIPLILSERAWAYGMQLRQEANSEPRKKFHLISKLKKACVYSLQLKAIVNSDYCDARTKLEAEAYNSFIHGSYYFEMSQWKEAAENLKKAQVVYENLVQALPEDEQILYKQRIDEITPSLRYCAYNIGENTSMNDLLEMRGQGMLKNLDSLVAQTKTEQTDAFQSTEWRGRKVTVRPQKVRLFLLSIQDLNKSVEKGKDYQPKIDIIENVLLDCKDAISALKDEIKSDPKLRLGTQEGQVSSIQFLLSYLSYIRLKLTLERNLYLIGQAKQNMQEEKSTENAKKVRSQDISRLYEIILQNISELQQLSGVENEKEYQMEIETLSNGFKAFRCYYIALTLVNLKRWKEAVSMYERSLKYANDALKQNLKEFNLDKDLKDLLKIIEGSKFSAHAHSVLEADNNQQEETALYGKMQKSTKPLFERLDQYKEDPTLNSRNPNVYKITPEMEPIPCKPLFFDLALNFVEFPSLDDKIETTAYKKAGTGLTGFVKGFLGFGGEKK